MIGHLFRKELREHRRTFVLLASLEGLVLLVSLINAAARKEAATLLGVLQLHLVLIAPLGGSILAQALIAKEHRERTILFLEALPVKRWHVLAAKVLLGALAMFGLTAMSWGVVVWGAARSEPISSWFALILAAKCAAYTAFLFGLLVLGAALGRYRYALYLLLFIGIFAYDQVTGELSLLPPFSLVGARFPVERAVMPARDLIAASAAGAAFLAFAFALLVLRGGSVAVLLGEKMSHREKVMVAVALISALYAATLLTEQKPKPPYALEGRSVVRREGPALALAVSPAEISFVPPEEIAGALFASLAPLAGVFGVEKLPPVFVIHRADLDLGRFEPARVAKRDGVVLRANLGAHGLDQAGLAAFATGEVIDHLTRERAWVERSMWVRDGFAEWWACTSDARREVLRLRASYAAREGYGPRDVARWYTVREELGPSIASALAWSGLAALESREGRERVLSLAREVLRPDPPKGLAAVGSGVPDVPGLAAAWEAFLARSSGAELPRVSGRVEVVERSALSRQLRVSTSTSGSVLWKALGALDTPIPEHELERTTSARAGTIVVPRTFARGTRVYTALAVHVPALGCEVRALAARRTLE